MSKCAVDVLYVRQRGADHWPVRLAPSSGAMGSCVVVASGLLATERRVTAADWNVAECGDIDMDQGCRVRVLDTAQHTARDTIDARLWGDPPLHQYPTSGRSLHTGWPAICTGPKLGRSVAAPGQHFANRFVAVSPTVIHLACTHRTGEGKYGDAPEVNLGGISTDDLGDHRAYLRSWAYLSSWAVWDPAPTTSRAWSSW